MILDFRMLELMMLVIIYDDVRYQKNFTKSQPIRVKFIFDGVGPNDLNGYALVLTNKLFFFKQ